MNRPEATRGARLAKAHRQTPLRRWSALVAAVGLGVGIAIGVRIFATIANLGSQVGLVAANLPSHDPLRVAPAGSVSQELSFEEDHRPTAAPAPSPARAEYPELAAEHQPAEPAMQTMISDHALMRQRLETLLASDPETLAEARALLDERDPNVLARNLQLLQESFAFE